MDEMAVDDVTEVTEVTTEVVEAPVVTTEVVEAPEVRSVCLGQKRAMEDEVEGELEKKKKARGGGGGGMAVNVKKVAEIVLVLAAMGEMRGGRKPTAVEVEMMVEAREKLVEICEEFSPKDVFPMEAFGTIIEDLGLNRLRETKLGIRPPKMSIVERLQLTKQKMEKSEVFPVHSTSYTSRAQSNPVRTIPPGKPDHLTISSGSFQTAVHASSVSNSRNLPYQLPTSEVRPVGSNVLSGNHLGRNSTALPIPQGVKPHIRSDEVSNAKPAGEPGPTNPPLWSMQSQSVSFTKPPPANLTNINHHVRHRMNFVQSPAVGNHNEISKIVQKILQPQKQERVPWTPPSRDYMNKALTCQTCKIMINEIDTALVCDACERGYHLKCLNCNPKAICGDEWHEWHCAKCLTISNGKPLPPKYGRVMRNISTPKMSSGLSGNQPSLDKKIQSSEEKFNQELMSSNSCGPHESGIEKSCPEKVEGNLGILSESGKPPENSDDNQTGKIPEEKILEEKESDQKVENLEDKKVVEEGNMVKTGESCVGEEEGLLSMREAEWVGGVLNEVDGKSFYGSCSVNGVIYKLQDYALFSSTSSNLMPNKLQGMWEDNETKKKWVTVTRCFFPGDLPDGVGRPCAQETNEVYESNHETTLAAGLIHGPCEVLPPCKLSQNPSPKPLFLCKWFYDEKKRLFRDVTC